MKSGTQLDLSLLMTLTSVSVQTETWPWHWNPVISRFKDAFSAAGLVEENSSSRSFCLSMFHMIVDLCMKPLVWEMFCVKSSVSLRHDILIFNLIY